MEFGPKQETASRLVSGRVAKGYPESDVQFNIAIPRTADFAFIRTLPTMLTPSRHRAEGWQKTGMPMGGAEFIRYTLATRQKASTPEPPSKVTSPEMP
jgi:hypothetical protein